METEISGMVAQAHLHIDRVLGRLAAERQIALAGIQWIPVDGDPPAYYEVEVKTATGMVEKSRFALEELAECANTGRLGNRTQVKVNRILEKLLPHFH